MPKRLRNDLEMNFGFYGLTANAIRAKMGLIIALFEASVDRAAFDCPLKHIAFSEIVAQIETMSKRLPERWGRIKAAALSLEPEMHIDWTEAWAELQRCSVFAGMSVRDDPVPTIALVAIAHGLGPQEVDREWAWQHEATLRSDRQITWARAVQNFDGLRDVLIDGGPRLLPADDLGPMPPRGGRARHGRFPLPRSIEEALDQAKQNGASYTKMQLNEMAHFVWRFSREIGLFERGDQPGVSDLICPNRFGRRERTCGTWAVADGIA